MILLFTLLLLNIYYSMQRPALEAENFVLINGGVYNLGEKGRDDNPGRKTKLVTFYMYKTEITNRQFKAFADATAYVSTAEQHKNGMIFYPGLDDFEWVADTTASWRYPNGVKNGGITGKMDHPVTCISYMDALAFCEWAGVRLPTLDEWEVACRANSSGLYYFGNTSEKINDYANIWLSPDHKAVIVPDPYIYTSPVGSFKPNSRGLFDMYGNVFEFCSTKPAYIQSAVNAVCSRGGSWWCSKNSCNFFNSVNIGRVDKLASFSNQGFRVVCDNLQALKNELIK